LTGKYVSARKIKSLAILIAQLSDRQVVCVSLWLHN